MKEEASETRILVRREYDMVQSRLRRVFNIPEDELIIDFEWDKKEGVLRLTTLKDK